MSHGRTSHRQWYEDRQKDRLRPYAVHEADNGGREVPEPPHPYRTCYHRDRDRIVHCSAFRRLDFKTQVFVPHEQDHFRTRLTHTLEVAQIARTLGGALRLNEDLIEVVALAHDLGHPPFGHSGEEVLAELMSDHGGFEHNYQSLRIVEYLEHPYPQFRGLNLTRVVRECLSKHQTCYDNPGSTEFAPGLFAPLEGQLVDLTDEIAYTSADLEDALGAGWIDEAQLDHLALWSKGWEAAEIDAPDARKVHKRIRAVKGVLSQMADDLLTATAANVAALRVNSPEDARRAPRRCVSFSDSVAPAVREMQDFLFQEVYRHPMCIEQAQASKQIIQELFDGYLRNPDLLPQRYLHRVETNGLHRVICDYIAGMTDRFCRQEHSKLKP